MKAFFIIALILLSSVLYAMEKPSWKLFRAIENVESSLGKTSGNVYQIQPGYVADVNRIQRKLERIDGIRRERFSLEDVFSRIKSERMMMVYWSYYSKRIINGTSYEVLARLHRVGFAGLRIKKTTADIYWRKVRKELLRYQ